MPSRAAAVVMLSVAVTPIDGLPGTAHQVKKPQRIAIIGGGLAGLSTAVNLLDEGHTVVKAIHIYDPFPPGCGGASAVAAGLLHPFGRNGRELWHGRAGFAATVGLIRRCEAYTSQRVSSSNGLLRLALTSDQADVLKVATQDAHDDLALEQTWLTCDEVSTRADVGMQTLGAAFAPSALSVDTPAYLRALWALCKAESATAGIETEWRSHRVDALADLQNAANTPYDTIIVASGSRAAELRELHGLADVLRLCRGQNLLFENKAGLQTPIISGKYIVPVMRDGLKLLAGATFEYDPSEVIHRPADPAVAAVALRGALEAMHPPLARAQILDTQAGVRALPPRSHLGYVPIAGRLACAARETTPSTQREESVSAPMPIDGTWLVGGLGSRGLIHHGLMGRAVAKAVVSGDETQLPEHVRRCQHALPVLHCWRRQT